MTMPCRADVTKSGNPLSSLLDVDLTQRSVIRRLWMLLTDKYVWGFHSADNAALIRPTVSALRELLAP